MKRLINNGDIFDKYVSFEDKKFRDETIKEFNWQGHRRIAGTYKGAAYSTSLADNFMADSLRNDSNPKGSLLVAAKNYTDQKVATAGKTLYAHYMRLRNGNTNLVFSYISSKAEGYTVATLKADLKTETGIPKKIACNGYYNSKPTQYISVDGESFVVAALEDNGAITRNTVHTFDVQDLVEAI